MRKVWCSILVALVSLAIFAAPAEARARNVTRSDGTFIVINDSGAGSPYPTSINLPRRFARAKIKDVNVTLRNVNHTCTQDIEVLLAHKGRAVMVMSDIGTGCFTGPNADDVVNETFTFDDEAAAPLPFSNTTNGGTFQPTDYSPGDTLPAPAPAPTGPTLSVFDGQKARGAWQLFVSDAASGDSGNIASGWTLQVRLRLPS